MTTFVLKDPSAKEPTLIYLTHYFNGRRFKLSTGEKVHPKSWNPEKHRPRSNGPVSASLNIFLDRFESKIKEAHLDLRANFQPITTKSLKESIYGSDTTGTFMEFFSRFVEKKSEAYQSVRKLLSSYHRPKDFDDINKDWFDLYQSYLEGKGYTASYVDKNLSIISEVLRVSGRSIDTGFRRSSGDVETIYLTEYELLKIYGIELPENLGRVRDRFLIGAFSGLRFGDSAKITQDSIRQGLIFDKNIKTGTRVVIPIHWVIEQIMADNPSGLPPSISNQSTNKYLKKIGLLAGIDDTILINRTKGGRVVSKTYKKYDLITSHTARRSAITNMVLAGIPTQAIMAISGHRHESSFQKYVKMSKESNALSLKDHPFFKLDC